MFGHDDKDQNEEEHVTGDAGQVVQPIGMTPTDENVVGAAPTSAPATPTGPITPVNASDDEDDDISKIVDDINASDDTEAVPDLVPTAAPTEPEEAPKEETESAEEPTLHETPSELLEVKKSALQELSPLLDELDQTADEKLDILMMTIQATDDQALLPQALATAKKIEDKKARAEAMLEIIQEINYFTKKK
jgi:hypothetical protein